MPTVLSKLEQVFTNVIQNAVNAMNGQGGTLGIRIESEKNTGMLNMLKIDISDTGPGIPEELLRPYRLCCQD